MQGYASSVHSIQNGLPRRSPLSITLFQIFTAGIPVNETGRLFMDDCALFVEREFVDQVQSKLQLALVVVQYWGKKNHVSFNPAKCTVLPFSGTGSRYPCSRKILRS